MKSIDSYNEFDDYTDIISSKYNKNKKNTINKQNDENTINDYKIPKNIINNTNNNTNKKTNSNKKAITNSIFNETKKKLGKIFFTKKRKNINSDYIETEATSTETTIEIERNVAEFLEKAKGIIYKGYNYKIKEEDYFERRGVKIKTILNSEDAAIKKCEELCDELVDKKKFILFFIISNDSNLLIIISLFKSLSFGRQASSLLFLFISSSDLKKFEERSDMEHILSSKNEISKTPVKIIFFDISTPKPPIPNIMNFILFILSIISKQYADICLEYKLTFILFIKGINYRFILDFF